MIGEAETKPKLGLRHGDLISWCDTCKQVTK